MTPKLVSNNNNITIKCMVYPSVMMVIRSPSVEGFSFTGLMSLYSPVLVDNARRVGEVGIGVCVGLMRYRVLLE